jgi:hypothetical protein
MRKAIVLGIGLFIGVALGYVCGPYIATGVLMKREPFLLFESVETDVESSAFSTQADLKEQQKRLITYQEGLARVLTKYPSDRPTSFYDALAEARLSSVESSLNNPIESTRHMQAAQQHLSELGWKDVSSEHILAVVAYVYKANGKSRPSPCACSEQTSAKSQTATPLR